MILFGQSYFLRFDPKLWEGMQPYPPLGSLYAAAYARSLGYDVAMFDAMLADSEADWDAALARHAPRFAVLFEDNFNYLSKMCLLRMRQAAFSMIAMAKARGCTVIVCGADATDHAADYLARGADYVLIGEGEHSLGELLGALTGRSDAPPAAIPGVHAPDTVAPVRRPDIRDLDALPFPAWDLADLPRYREVWLRRHGYFSLNMVTTRGCPYHCNWCAKPIWGQRYNSRSPENVAAELAELRRIAAPDHIWFADDIFGLRPGWIERFAELVEDSGARVPFKCLLRADLVTERAAANLARAGCRTVWIGAESGSQKVLDAMDKGTTQEDIRRATRLLRANGIEVGFFLQFGYPGETWPDIALTRRMVRECMPDDIGISVSYPLPGTPFFAHVQTELGDARNWRDSNDLALLFRGAYPPDFYRVLHRVVHAEYRLRKMWARCAPLSLRRAAVEAGRFALGRARLEVFLRSRR